MEEPTQKIIIVGEKQIPMGSTPRPKSLKKLRVKFTTKRKREEEMKPIREEITRK